MKTLEDACRQLTACLEQVGKAVETTRGELGRFEKYSVYWPVTWVELRLLVVELQVATEAAQQSSNHDGKGTVCIMTVHERESFRDVVSG